VKNDETWEKGQPIYFDFEVVNNLIDGKWRIETFGTNEYHVFNLGGKLEANRNLTIFQKSILKESTKSTNPCFLNFQLEYNYLTGYLEGTYDSKCPEDRGKIILYKSKFD
jgi:hypothetical protein